MVSRFAQMGNDLYTGARSYNFVGRLRLWLAIAGILVVLSVGLLFTRGLNAGIEFTGGSSFVISGVSSTDSAPAQEAVAEITTSHVPQVAVLGSDSVRVQTEQLTSEESEELALLLADAYDVEASEVTSSFVGPQWGADVTQKALTALVVFLVLVTLVMTVYFRAWTMAAAAVLALLSDVVITVGVYALSGFEVSPASVIGFLTILGYSLYDTVVVFDKVRENTEGILDQSRITYGEASNLAVNQTVVRSINTSVVGLLPIGSILFVGVYLLGAGTLRDIALALFIGLIVSTASSIFLAAPIEVALRTRLARYRDHTTRVLQSRRGESTGAVESDEEGFRVSVSDVQDEEARVVGTVPGSHLGSQAQPRRKGR